VSFPEAEWMPHSPCENLKTFDKFISKQKNNLPVPPPCHIFDFQRHKQTSTRAFKI
jgi:hypothetical protein